jgi:hypothetical protein
MDHNKTPETILINILNNKIDKTMYKRCFIKMEKYIENYKLQYISNEYEGILKYFIT